MPKKWFHTCGRDMSAPKRMASGSRGAPERPGGGGGGGGWSSGGGGLCWGALQEESV